MKPFALLSSLACGTLLAMNLSCAAAPKPVTSRPQTKTQPSASLTLVEKGKSAYVIAVASDAIPAERTAAKELQSYLKQVTGATLPLKNEGEVSETAPQILVGAGKRVKRLLPRQKWVVGNDGIVIKTQGKNLIMAGSRPRGSLYAVYQFLEDAVGLRWWTPTDSTVPRTPTLRVPPQNLVYVPPFAFREHLTREVIIDPVFATKMRENGTYQAQNEDWGGHYKILGGGHTFEQLLPLEKYFKDHPEWYSDPANDNKPCTAASQMPRRQTWQLNLTNEDARHELTINALEWVRKDPSAGIISISQNDNMNYCKSEGDLALIEREGSPMGPLLHFVNAVAEDIEKEFPGFLVETLAYQHTRHAPRTLKPRENVIIRLCSIEADFARPLDSQANAGFRDDVLAWAKITKHLYIWNYVINFSRVIWPHPNMRSIGPDLRFMARNKAFGVFEQGDAYSNGVGDFVQMRTWITARLMWNPQQDQDKLMNEFLRAYYGAAAPHLRAYIDLMQDEFLKTGKPLSTFSSDFDYLTFDVVSRARAFFASAAKASADNPEIARRVRRERLALDNVILGRYRRLAIEAASSANNNDANALPADMQAFAAEFIATARANGVLNYSEGGPFDDYAKLLTTRFRPTAPLPEPLQTQISAEDMLTRVIDVQEVDFVYYMQSLVSNMVDDPLASNGMAASEIGNSNEWGLQYTLHGDQKQLSAKPWRYYAVVRIEAKPGADLDAPAFVAGIYNFTPGKFQIETRPKLRGLEDGQYHLVDLGEVRPDDGCLLWVAPPKREDITTIFIDRLLLVQDK